MLEPSAAAAAEVPAAVQGLRRWLAGGRPQAAGGAFCAWRDAARDELAFEYPEITGYALTWLAARPTPSAAEVAAGRRAADWLAARFAEGDRSARADYENGAVYTFDLGMIAAGLMSFGAVARVAAYSELGREIALSLSRYLADAGELPAVAPDGPATTRAGEWSTDGRVHLVKCVQALLLAEERDAGRQLAEQAYADQRDDGHFVTQPGDAFVMLHAHLYTVEGLWMWGTATADERALDSARRAAEWAWRHQLPSGGFPRWVSESDPGPEQLDATAQAIRAAVVLGLRPEGLQRAAGQLAAGARSDGEHGDAIVYRPTDAADHLNVCVTMFSEQALSLANGEPNALGWHELV